MKMTKRMMKMGTLMNNKMKIKKKMIVITTQTFNNMTKISWEQLVI